MNKNTSRRIIESLRTGVPSYGVIKLLGSGQPILDERFSLLLKSKKSGDASKPNGFVFFGGFGTGKSHVLESFAASAADQNFVVSRATISQNLKIGTTNLIIAALLENTATATHKEDGFANILGDATSTRPNLSTFLDWTKRAFDPELGPSIYSGIVECLQRTRYGTDEFELIVSFLSGANVGTKLKTLLKRPGQCLPSAGERPHATIRFLTELFLTLGYSGWVVLFDELELIRLLPRWDGRGRSYSELSKWFGFDSRRPSRGLTVIGCMTSGYVAERIQWTLGGPNELDEMPTRLASSARAFDLCEPATSGMNLLIEWDGDNTLQLQRPSPSDLARVQNAIKQAYDDAYSVKVQPVYFERSAIDPIRVNIRRWIVSWDLQRAGKVVSLSDSRVVQNFTVDEDEPDSNLE